MHSNSQADEELRADSDDDVSTSTAISAACCCPSERGWSFDDEVGLLLVVVEELVLEPIIGRRLSLGLLLEGLLRRAGLLGGVEVTLKGLAFVASVVGDADGDR